MAEFTSDGLAIDTQAEIQAELETDQRAEISTSLDLSTSAPLGQLNRLLARALRLEQEVMAAIVNMTDPDSASGDALRRIGAITGTFTEAATASRVAVPCDLDAGTYTAGTLVVNPVGRSVDKFANLETVVAPGGSVSVIFEALATGPIQAAANTLVISAAVAGWNSIGAHPDATLGSAGETEAAFRQRRNNEVEAPGSSSVDGIVADLTRNIPGIISAAITENVTDATVDSIPAHSFEAVVFGPDPATADDDQAVADQIEASKASGVGTYGTTTKTVTDSQGQTHTISFTRPADVTIDVALTAATGPDYAGDAALEAAIRAAALAGYVPGLDAAWSQFVGWSMPVAGVLRISSVALNGGGPFNDVAISTRQKAKIGDVTITSASATP